MKKELKAIVEVFVAFLALLWLEKPLRIYFSDTIGMEMVQARLLAGALVRCSILAIAIYGIGYYNLLAFNGLQKGSKAKNLHALLIPGAFVAMGLMSNREHFLEASAVTLILYTGSVFTVGFLEEFVFRGTILPMFIRIFKKQDKVLYISAICTGLLFGSVHFINLFSQPDNFRGVTSQVFFAISIGVFFGGLLLRTGHIFIPALLHGCVNFAFGTGELAGRHSETIVAEATSGTNWNSLIPTALFFAFILLGGLFMIGKVAKESIIAKLEEEPFDKTFGNLRGLREGNMNDSGRQTYSLLKQLNRDSDRALTDALIGQVNALGFHSNTTDVYYFYFPIVSHILYYKPEYAPELLHYLVGPNFANGAASADEVMALIEGSMHRKIAENPFYLSEESKKWVTQVLPGMRAAVEREVEQCRRALEDD